MTNDQGPRTNWLGVIPPRHLAPTVAAMAAREAVPGDPLVITPDEARQLDRLADRLPSSPHPDEDFRMAVCRGLGPGRVAVVIGNFERGFATPVEVVE